MIVIKLGGSLLATDKLRECLDVIESRYQKTKVVIVPGGGCFADLVRNAQQQWQFNDLIAHQMAILAMQQMALLFSFLKPGFEIRSAVAELVQATASCGILIWSPNIAELDAAGIPANWDITSDSLAAWLAKSLTADELILVKSVKIDPAFDVLKLVKLQVVDTAFPGFIHQTSFKINIINAEKFIQ